MSPSHFAARYSKAIKHSTQPEWPKEGNDFRVNKYGGVVVKEARHFPRASVPYNVLLAHHLHGLVPETHLLDPDTDNPKIGQKYIEGREPTDEELEWLRGEIVKRGVTPRDLTKSNSVVSLDGKVQTFDTSNFTLDDDLPPGVKIKSVPPTHKLSSEEFLKQYGIA